MILRVTDALNQVQSYSYDDVGNRITETDKRNNLYRHPAIALNMGIDDLRATSGNRYDQHLDEMFDNLSDRSNGNVDWGLLKRKE